MNKIVSYSLLLISALLPFLVYRSVRVVSAQSGPTLSIPISGPTATPTLSSPTTPTPTRIPTPTVKPTAVPTKKPTPTPTPKPIINRPPVIKSNTFYFAKRNKGFVFNIPIIDREGDKVTANVIGKLPKGVVSWCNYGPYGFGCYFSGKTSQIGFYPFKIEAIDSRGAKSVDYSYLIVTIR
jgi:hypothetical protein